MIEELETEYIESMRPPSWIEHVARKHCIEVEPSQLNSETAQEQQIELGIVGRLADRRVLQQIAKRLHLWCVERREITNNRWTFFSQHSGRNAHCIAVGLLFFSRLPFREDLITAADQPTFLGRIRSRPVAWCVNKQFTLTSPW